jgi:UDP-N-acetylmuramate dehydrogenase
LHDKKLARLATQQSIDGFGFLAGIPGSIGGAIRSNAGAYRQNLENIFVEATAIDRQGNYRVFTRDDLQFSYRTAQVAPGVVFTKVKLFGASGQRSAIQAKILRNETARKRETPFRAQTAGSTFRNPDGHSAWRLIAQCDLRGHTVGKAQVSSQHANYLINLGGATAFDLEQLGEQLRQRVRERTGVSLEWEVERIGRAV